MPKDPIAEAVAAATEADVAVIVAGLGADWESEGFDRPDLSLPQDQNTMIAAVAAAQPNTVVVLTAGSAVEMPWIDDVSAVVQAWYGGQEIGAAVADVLLGVADPGGRLPVTFPATSRQHPGLLNYPGEAGQVHYGEGVYVGYRGYDQLGLEPLFGFGHGLSYTSLITPTWLQPQRTGRSLCKVTSRTPGRDAVLKWSGYSLATSERFRASSSGLSRCG